MFTQIQSPVMTTSMTFDLNDSTCWDAVVSRDQRFDGQFVYAVRSTGVYCRPSCGSRLAGREQVAFYEQPDAAEAAGFRPCKRCSPHTQAYEAQMVETICRYIETHLDNKLTLDELGEQANLSPTHLQRVFKRAMGITPRQYAEARRMELFRERVQGGESVTEALYNAGYSSSSRLYEGAVDKMGMTPATLRKGGRGMRIQFTVTACALGLLLVGATEKGVCAVSLGDSHEALEKELRGRYPAADIRRDEAGLGEWVSALLDYLEGERPHLDLPLDVQATAFQQRVWQVLRNIPYGETRTYSAVAQAIGQPKAARAVAQACASNPTALVIPCHRVVRGDGDLGGYRWGIGRKESLLKKERF